MGNQPPKTPLATVDVIVESGGGIVLIRRRNPPHGWALPGGFVDPGESVPQAARREAKEETGLDVELTELLGVYSDPKRDPRGLYTISTVFVARAAGRPVRLSVQKAAAHPRCAREPLAVRRSLFETEL